MVIKTQDFSFVGCIYYFGSFYSCMIKTYSLRPIKFETKLLGTKFKNLYHINKRDEKSRKDKESKVNDGKKKKSD